MYRLVRIVTNGSHSNAIEEAKQRIVEVQAKMVWDRLVIAFFGSTNAGKSTIIETLRLRHEDGKKDADGTIVGDGSPDFTETFDHYNLSMKGKIVTVIDMPGIFGDEEKYVKQIRSNLNEAHIIFYVHREETKPDTKTVERIKSYLQDWVKVYSIYNVSKPKYDPENPLNSETHLQSEQIIISGFKEALGDSYKGNISLIALYALASIANFNDNKVWLKKTQAKMLKSAESKELLFQESGMMLLETLIENLSDNYLNNIFEANMKRLAAIRTKTSLNLLEALKQQEKMRKELPLELLKFKSDIDSFFSQAQRNLHGSIQSIIKKEIRELQRDCNLLVDNKSKQLKKECENKQKQSITNIQKEIMNNIPQILNDLKNNLERRQEQISGVILDYNFNIKFQLDNKRINFDGVEDIINFNFDKMLDIIKDVSRCACLGLIGGNIGMGVGAVLGFAKGMYSLLKGDMYRQEAKKAIHQAFQLLEEDMIKKTDLQLGKIIREMEVYKFSIKIKIDDELKNVKLAEENIRTITINL